MSHQHVGPQGTVTCYADHAERPHDLVAAEALDPEALAGALEALKAAQRSPSKYRADFEQDARFILARLRSESDR